MVIDTHIHPALFAPICEDQERFRRRCDAMNYHLMKPSDMALLRKQEAAKKTGDKEQIAAVQKQLNVFCGLLIALFVCVLAVTMFNVYSAKF